MAKVMRVDRTIVTVDDDFMLANASLLMYVQADDGVYVPACDADQYTRGDRPAVQTEASQ